MPKVLTSKSFAKLLTALSADEAEAAVLYTKLRDSLVRYFELKGISEANEAADETLDRIPERIASDTKSEEVNYIAFSVARYIFLEKIREEKKRTVAADGFHLKSGTSREADERNEFDALRECFKSLYDDERKLLAEYFADLSAGELFEHRQKLAQREGIGMNNLRNKISRLRRRLEDCVKEKN